MHRKKFFSKNFPNSENYFSSIFQWANSQFPLVCVLNSNNELINTPNPGKKENDLDAVIAVGVDNELHSETGNNFDLLKNFQIAYNSFKPTDLPNNTLGGKTGRSSVGEWLFGFLSYDLKNDLENLSSKNFDGIKMPLMHFFVPENLFVFKGSEITIHSSDKNFDLGKIIRAYPPRKDGNSKHTDRDNRHNTGVGRFPESQGSKIKLSPRISKLEYIEKVKKIKAHIQRGDIYEMNLCQEFYAKNAEINPMEVYLNLNGISPMPFSCFYKLHDKYLLCSSPERFLKKTGKKIISQPIKGTIQRGNNKKEDEKLIKFLFENKKEKSENVMIVDLVRNDLSRIAKAGTVRVDELFGIYSYKHLHQMISTVSCELDEGCNFIDAIKNTFPMGSMTGAPKVKAMELIEKYETTKRGLFSGAVGYIKPEGDFDFNVIIRSILYNKKNKYISVMAGSAITAESEPEKEYEECLLKAEPMRKALKSTKYELLRKIRKKKN